MDCDNKKLRQWGQADPIGTEGRTGLFFKMKNVYFIGGTMGVGKTTVCKCLMDMLENSVFLDGDWCWLSHPFRVTAETKRMVMNNICTLLNNFIGCSAYDNIIFCWVMHEQSIIDDILDRLDLTCCRLINVSLVCEEKELVRRLHKDIAAGLRTDGIIERSVSRLEMYRKLNTVKIDTTHLSPEDTARKILMI